MHHPTGNFLPFFIFSLLLCPSFWLHFIDRPKNNLCRSMETNPFYHLHFPSFSSILLADNRNADEERRRGLLRRQPQPQPQPWSQPQPPRDDNDNDNDNYHNDQDKNSDTDIDPDTDPDPDPSPNPNPESDDRLHYYV
ncbi:hypothetical protein HOO65_021133 [Ceratocystis lukuohia]|uniref:Uncharacterized protein n=1 Tax=Ceratocystis lukuohia TaxID=2019550 RepID=A0ABR4MQM7_9PEZI